LHSLGDQEISMEVSVASKTALVTALMRALHTRADPQPIILDPWGDLLVPDSAREKIRERALSAMSVEARTAAESGSESIVDAWLHANAAYTTVITRSRYAEDALHAAVARGVQQYVLIGAGFDSYALRTPAEAQHVRIFEIDHLATQTRKKQRIVECGIPLRDSIYFLSADLAQESLSSVLSRSEFDPSELTFFSWLGVTMYLTREANLASLRAIAQCAPSGSELVFTYIDQEVFLSASSSRSGSFADLQRSVKSVGEPFISGFDPSTLAQDLQSVGFELQEDLTDFQVLDRYDPLGVNSLRPASYSRIARARIADEQTQRTA
jgi:methyltransferase (TIGR00027 family)